MRTYIIFKNQNNFQIVDETQELEAISKWEEENLFNILAGNDVPDRPKTSLKSLLVRTMRTPSSVLYRIESELNSTELLAHIQNNPDILDSSKIFFPIS